MCGEAQRLEPLRLFEQKFGGRWCGVKLTGTDEDSWKRPRRPMRFCEAVAKSRTGPVVLTPDLLECPGGRRSMGWYHEETLARRMAQKASVHIDIAQDIIDATPRLENPPANVVVGLYHSPDVALSYLQPEDAMNLVRAWQRRHGGSLTVHASSFMSVCGVAAIGAYLTDAASISFGCPEARESGCITRDRLIVALPMREVIELSAPERETVAAGRPLTPAEAARRV